MLAVVQWLPNTDGFWDVPGNWSSGSVPGVNDDVIIDRGAANPQITVRSGSPTVKSIQSTELLALTGGTLTVSQSIQGTGTVKFDGGTLTGATVSSNTVVVATGAGGTLDGVTLNSDLDLTTGSAQVTVLNGLVLNGTATLGESGVIDFNGTQTLAGNGQVVFDDAWANALLASEEGMTLTIGPNITIRGGSGEATYGASAAIGTRPWPWYGGASDFTIVNQATVSADVAGRYIQFVGGSLTNQGTLAAIDGGGLYVNNLSGNLGNANLAGGGSQLSLDGTDWVNNLGLTAPADTTLSLSGSWTNPSAISVVDGTLNLGGTFTLSDLGTLNRSGGTVNLTGTLDNTATTLVLDSGTGSWNVAGGTLLGGTVNASDGAQLTFGSGTLDGVTLNSDLDLTTGSAQVTVLNGLVLNGTATLGESGVIDFNGTQTLAGNGQVVFDDAWANALLASEEGMTLTIGPNITIRGGSSEATYGASAAIGTRPWPWYGGASDFTIVNQGTVSADAAGRYIQFVGGSLTNQGTLAAIDGGGLYVNNLSGNLGNANLAGGGSQLSLDGTDWVNNLGLTAPADTTLSLSGSWTNPATITAVNSTLYLGSDSLPWSNTGTISASNSDVDLGGIFTLSTLGTFNRSGGTVNLTGTLDNTATTLVLDSGTGSWNVAGGTLLGGTVNASDGAQLTFGSGTLDGVTLNSDLDLTTGSAQVTVLNGLVLNGTATLGESGVIDFNGTQTLAGNGQVVFDDAWANALLASEEGMTLTIGPNITIRGGSGEATYGASAAIGTRPWPWYGGASDFTIVNQATVSADVAGRYIQFVGGSLTNQGTLAAIDGGTLYVAGTITNYSAGTLTGGTWSVGAGSTLQVQGVNVVTNAATIKLAGDNSNFYSDDLATSALASLTTNLISGNLSLLNGRELVTSGNLTNAGTITTGVGSTLRVYGNYQQSSTGTWTTQLSGTSPDQFGRLAVNNQANLAGTLNVIPTAGFSPLVGNAFDVLSFGSRSGAFHTVNGVNLAGGLFFRSNYAATTLTLEIQVAIVVTPVTGLTTSEAGGTAQFSVVLAAQPTSNVTIGISSSDTTEGTVSVASLIFTPANWNVPKIVTVTGVNDFVDDGDVAYTIITAPAISTDLSYAGVNSSDVAVINIDDDSAGIVITPTSGLTTTETGGTAQFSVVLTSQPISNVSIALSSSDPAEGTLGISDVVFTPANWNVPRTVTVTGADDTVDDGDVGYFIVTAAAVSGDPVYNGINPADVSITNLDDDRSVDLQVQNLTVTPTNLQSGSTVTVSWNDFNAGDGATRGAWYDRLAVVNQTTGQSLINTTIFYDPNELENGDIPAGGFRARQFTFQLPDGAAGAGPLQFTVTIDAFDSIFEANVSGTAETNNQTSVTRTSSLPAYPDLIISNISAPAVAIPGQSVTVSWTLTNQGAGVASGTWSDQLYLSNDATIGSDAYLANIPFAGSIPSGQSIIRQAEIVIPAFAAGNQFVVARTNVGGGLFESNAANNAAIDDQPLQISSALQLTISRNSAAENSTNPAITGRVTRNGSIANALTVALSTGSSGLLSVPATVTIPAGIASVPFDILTVNNAQADGDQMVTLSANAAGFNPATVQITVSDDDVPALQLVIVPETLAEDSVNPATLATLTRNTSSSVPMTVDLFSENPSRATVPVSVTIPAGQKSITFPVTTVNNAETDGTSIVTIRATHNGLASGSDQFRVTDDDLVQLSLGVATETIVEGTASPALIATVSRSVVTSAAQLVTIVSSNSAAASVPSQVIIPANQSSISFVINAPDNTDVQGTRQAIISAYLTTPSGGLLESGSASKTLSVLDDDGPTLSLLIDPASIAEGGHAIGTVTRNTNTSTPLVVTLSSLDPTEATVPTTVTIATGQVSANFTVQGVADGISDGSQATSIKASADGFNSGSAGIVVSDRDLPDLRVTVVNSVRAARTGDTINVTWTVANQGVVPVSGSWLDRVYISSDNQLGDDTLAGSSNFNGDLAVGGSYTRAAQIVLPNFVGTYFILVQTDAADFVVEGSETNNARSSQAIEVQPAYRATVQTAIELDKAGTPIPLTGRAFDPLTDAPAANQPVTIRVLVQGTRREIHVLTDASGNFSTVFQPLPGEAGRYTIGADHPGVTTDVAQDQFSLVGMRAEPRSLELRVVPGSPISGTLRLVNLGDVPLSGLASAVIGAPANLNMSVATLSSLDSLGSAELAYSIAASDASQLDGRMTLRLSSTEGARLDIPVAVTVVPLEAQLVANPGTLSRGMLRGTQTMLSFEVTNIGGAVSEPLQVNLPSVPWMSLLSPATIASLAPREKAIVSLALNPAADLPLGLYEGNLSLDGQHSGLDQPFSLRAISEAVGDVRIRVEDEFTYFAAGAPLVAGAIVLLRDPFDNSVIVARGVTDAAGGVLLVGVPEGNYVLEVQAEKHATYRSAFTVLPGIANVADIFIQRQTVTYNWTVTPTEIEDRYRVVLETTFETNVPAPVVVLQLPSYAPPIAPGETTQIEAVLTNHGLIAAEDVTLSVRSPEGYIVTPLISNLGTLPANSQIKVPVMITRLAAVSLSADAGDDDDLDIPCAPFDKLDMIIEAAYTYICGIPIGAVVSALVLFQEANGLFIINREGAAEYVASCIGELIAKTIDNKPGQRGGGNVASTYSGGTGGFNGTCNADLPPYVFDEINAGIDQTQPKVGSFLAGAGANNGVCAQVRLKIDQQAVLTRTAFNGELEITNGHLDGNLEGVQLTLDFRDQFGNAANDKFTVLGPILRGVSAVDGTGSIAPSSRARVNYAFVPNRDAAPEASKRFLIGGTLRYIDPESRLEVVVPLLGATITVLPDPRLVLKYFQQRDVYSDDPHTDEVEPSEPFSLGLLVTNIGRGVAKNFTITSGQPQIIENEKGLLIDFKIIGTQIDTQQVSPSLTANLGTIDPAGSAVAQWIMTSTLQGKFIDYTASFEHLDSLGGKQTSLIESVEIHELIHTVRVDSPVDDGKPDFLVNDDPDPDNFPDALYLSDGSVAIVNMATNVVADSPVSLGQFQINVTANMTSGWNYFKIPDPGAGFRLQSITRSDGKQLRVDDNVWQTDRTFPSSSSGAVREHSLHLLDFDGTGSYTLRYVIDDSIAPQLIDVVDVTPDPRSGPVSSIDVVFSEPIDLATFDHQDITLTLNGGPNLITNAVEVSALGESALGESMYRISGLAALTAADGVYELTVIGSGISDFGGNPGIGTVADQWATGMAGPFVQSVGPITSIRNTPPSSIDVNFSEPLVDSTFDFHDLTLTHDGGVNLINAGVTIEPLSGTNYRIHGLADVSAAEGTYVLSIIAAGVTDLDGSGGVGVGTAEWIMDTTAPKVVAAETLATNPRNVVVRSIDVTLSESIDLATFTRDDLQLTRDGGSNLIDDRVQIEYVAGNVYRISGFNWVVGISGNYQLTIIGSGIADAAGNFGEGSASTTWIMDTIAPAATFNVTVTPDGGISNTDGLINTLTPTISGTLAESGLSVRLVDMTTGKDLGYAEVVGTQFSKTLSLEAGGAHRIQIRVIDQAGNVNQAARLMEPGGYVDLFIDLTRPVVTSVTPVDPNPRVSSVESVVVVLSEPIDPATFDWRDVRLTRDAGANLATSVVTVSHLSGSNYLISGLTGLTGTDGAYRLTVDAGEIIDTAGNLGIGSFPIDWRKDSTGAFLNASLSGRIFEDHNADALAGDGDQGLSGWTVFLDSNDNGVFDPGIDPSTLSTTAGTFSFTNLIPETYRAGVVPAAGWVNSLPVVPGALRQVALASGATANSVDFGFYLPGEIRGELFNDANGNAIRDLGETPLDGWTVFLDDNRNGILDSSELRATTGSDGSYRITDVRPGTHVVAQTLQNSWVQTSPGGSAAGVLGYSAITENADGTLSYRMIGSMHESGAVTGSTISALYPSQLTNPEFFLPFSADGNHYRWQDQDPSTPDVVDLYYDFRAEGAYANFISPQGIAAAEAALQLWETASLGRLSFTRNTTASHGEIINIGMGNLAALGGTSGSGQTLALGGGTFHDGPARTISSGVVWLDMAEIWDYLFGNGDIVGTFDFGTVVAHEVGHALGLGHTDRIPTADIQDGIYGGEKTSASLTDQTLIQVLYSGTSFSGGFGSGSFGLLANGFPESHVVKVSSGGVNYGVNFGNQQLDSVAPTVIVNSVQNGMTQRSWVNQLTFDFSEQMNFADLIANGTIVDAVTITNLGINAPNDPDVQVVLTASQFTYQFDPTSGLSRLDWSLGGSANPVSTLPDGYYRLVIDTALVTDRAGNALNGNGDLFGGDNYVITFHRLQGDVTGNGVVDAADLAVVNAALGSRPTPPPINLKWNPDADLDGDGWISVRDRTIVARNNHRQIVVEPSATVDRLSTQPIKEKSLPFDVNGDHKVSASDALAIINRLSKQQQDTEYDVNRDGEVTALDALQVINYLARSSSAERMLDPLVGSSIADDDEDLVSLLAQDQATLNAPLVF
jgi:hypothetical protein